MRAAISALSAFFLAAMVLFASVAALPAEDRSVADLRSELLREWYSAANGRTEFDISDPALVPGQLALAVKQSGCRYEDTIKEMPVRFITVEKRRLAFVFCSDIVGSHQVFDLLVPRGPKLLEFPFLSQPAGFGTTDAPGVITWNKEAGVFQAETGTDICPSSRIRHTYRPGLTRSRASFVIVRVEAQEDGCGRGEWTMIWEAPLWSTLAKPGAR
jgi:hypothetical protein